MSAASDRINVLLPRVLPWAAAALIVSVSYSLYLQPIVTGYTKSRAEAQSLETSLRRIQITVDRGRQTAWPDEAEPLRLFEARVSKDDHVADVAELLTAALNDSATDGKLRNLAIGTGDDALPSVPAGARKPGPGEAEPIDPRWSLFPYQLRHTPVSLSFDCSYQTIVNFLWRVRDLPTTIEVRSMKLTRGLPLMHLEFTFFVFQRGDSTAPAVQQPVQPAPETLAPPRTEDPAQNPFTPRLLRPSSGRSGG